MAWLTRWLPILGIPEQDGVTFMRLNMIDLSGRGAFALEFQFAVGMLGKV